MKWSHIACVEDLIRPKELLGAFPVPMFTLVGEPILQGTRQQVLFAPGKGLPDLGGAAFNWSKFTHLAFAEGDTSWEQLSFSLPEPAREYLRECIPAGSLLLGVEMPEWCKAWCVESGVDYLDLRISPLRFARDFYVALDTSSAEIHERLRPLSVPREELSLEAAAVSASVCRQNWEFERRGQFGVDVDDTLVYIGQTSFDAAIIGDQGRFLRCQDFTERLCELAARPWRQVLYKPHPYDEGFAAEEKTALESVVGRPVGTCFNNSYQLLGSTASVELVAISSGLLQEAEFFHKPAHWLHAPLVPLAWPDEERKAGRFLQVHFEDMLAPAFWQRLLAPELPAPRVPRLPALAPNYGREFLDVWWDYSKLKTWQRGFWREAFERSGGALLRQRIEALEKTSSQPGTEGASTMRPNHHDFSLNSGERQVATRYEDIRADHRYRYEWVDARLPEGGFGVDVFCGNGYGAWHLSRKRRVWGIDGSVEAIRLAEQHYRTPQAFFSQACYPFDLPGETFDFAVSLESIEHVEDGAGFFASLARGLKPGGLLFFSTPCEEKLPHSKFADTFHFHYRHYTFEETRQLAEAHGLELIDWAGQDVYSFPSNGGLAPLQDQAAMRLKERTVGQFLIFFCRRA